MRSIIPVMAVLITAPRAGAQAPADAGVSTAAPAATSDEAGAPSSAPPATTVAPEAAAHAATPAAAPSRASSKAKRPSGGKSKKKDGKLPRLDPKREEQEFQRALTLAQDLYLQSRCGAAYAMYLDLQKQRPEDPHVLMGVAMCGMETAKFPELGAAERRQRLLDAKVACERYAALPTTTAENAAYVHRRAGAIDSQIAALTTPVPVAPATPSPAVVAAPAAVPPPAACDDQRDAALLRARAQAQWGNYREAIASLTVLPARCQDDVEVVESLIVWKAAVSDCDVVPTLYAPIMEQSKQPAVHEAVVKCADRLNRPDILLAAFEHQVALVESPDPDALLTLADLYEAAGRRERAQAAVERFLGLTEQRPGMDAARRKAQQRLTALQQPAPTAEERARCLVRRGTATATLVQVGDRWVIQTSMPAGASCSE